MDLRILEHTLRATSPDGGRAALLVIGNGVHIQAAREAGLPDPDPWPKALLHIARVAGVRTLDGLPQSEPLRWDALVQRASGGRARPAQVHRRLGAAMLEHLRAIERRRRHLPLFGRIVALGFENILSLSIDRTLALHAGNETFARDQQWGPAILYRHSRISSPDGRATRIFYPHGDTADRGQIRLGTHGHAATLMGLEDARAPMMNDWVQSRVASWSYKGAKPRTTLKPPARFLAQCRQDAGWYRMAFVAPLVVIGASLPIEDWPMWWLLHQRARNLSVFPKRQVPPTFFLTAEGHTPWYLAGRPAGIETVEFPAYDSMWRFVLRR